MDAPLEVREGGIAERGVFATGRVAKGSWLCKYKGLVYPASERKKYEEMYNLNGEGSYIIESFSTIPNCGRMCWDATRRYHQIGRYINHAQKLNAKVTRPYEVRGKWRIGFVAIYPSY